MISWLAANMGTIVVAAVLMAVIGLIVRKLHTDRKKGIHSCGGNCGSCGSCGGCNGGYACGSQKKTEKIS